jgi:hypothetical protein
MDLSHELWLYGGVGCNDIYYGSWLGDLGFLDSVFDVPCKDATAASGPQNKPDDIVETNVLYNTVLRLDIVVD